MEDLKFNSDLQFTESLQYVQIEETEVLIDSRVYCRDIIQVDHGDWLRDTVYKYQTLIEQHFDHLRYETGNGINRPQGGGRQEKYVLLTEAQCNFALSLSKNSSEVVIKKAELIADFELAKKQLRQFFERSFQTSVFDSKVESLNKPPKSQPLPPADIRIAKLYEALIGFGIELDNPRYSQEIKDLVLDKIMGVKTLPSSQVELWCGVAERAEQLGYAVALVVKNRSMLGRFVKAHKLESRFEKRLCNGTNRNINLYKVTDELDATIREFMDAKVLSTN